jgi:hypothetical protein
MLGEQTHSTNIVESLHPTQLGASNKRVQILVIFPRIGWIDQDLALEQTRIALDESRKCRRGDRLHDNIGSFNSLIKITDLDTSEMKLFGFRDSRLGDLESVPRCLGVVVLEDMGEAMRHISGTDDSEKHH